MEENKWETEIKNELNDVDRTRVESEKWNKLCIYRVPASMSDLNEKAYKPQIVSLGPYHHGEGTLRSMEEHKHRALLHFLKRSGKPIESYISALTPVVQDLKDCYDELDRRWLKQDSNKAFLELMITDGAFILEIMRTCTTHMIKSSNKKQDHSPAQAHDRETQTLDDMGYDRKDPIFSYHGKLNLVPFLKREMLMLENQLPLLVLAKLVAVASQAPKTNNPSNSTIVVMIESDRDDALKKAKEWVVKLVLKFFSAKNVDTKQEWCHILDIYRKSHLSEVPRPTKPPHTSKSSSRRGGGDDDDDEIIRSATELYEAGIKFQKSKTRSLKDVRFENGVLHLPLVVVDDTLESSYRNMMVFERFHVDAGNDISSFVFFLDSIIDNPQDVSLLHSSHVIQNALGSDKAVSKLFNSLATEITLDPKSSLEQVHQAVNDYCQKGWNRSRAALKHNYFTNPWAGISVIAAIFLFALTIVQTVYSVLAYY